MQELAKKLFQKDEVLYFVLSDGTSFGYHDFYPLKILRGTEIRKVKSSYKVKRNRKT